VHGLIHVALDLGIAHPPAPLLGRAPDSPRRTASKIPLQSLRHQLVDGLALLSGDLSDAFPKLLFERERSLDLHILTSIVPARAR
jgi:hypothetical protein